MKTSIKFSGLNEDGFKKFKIDHSYDEILDLVYAVTGLSFYTYLNEGINELSFKNALSLNQGFEIYLPVVKFKLLGEEVYFNKYDSKSIMANNMKSLEENFELEILNDILNWNKSFLDFSISILFPSRKSISFDRIKSYYLENKFTKDEYLPQIFESIIGDKISRKEIINRIILNLQRLESYSFLPENFIKHEFNLKKPTENFFTKLTGQYQRELKEFESRKIIFSKEEEEREIYEKNIVSKYQSLTRDFASKYIEIFEKMNNSLIDDNYSDKSDLENQIFSVLKNNILTLYYDFQFDFYLKNSSALLEVILPNFEDFNNLKNIKNTKVMLKRLEIEYKEICFSILFGLVDLIFYTDKQKQIDQVFFNGIVDHLDRSIGNQKRSCVISISISRNEFENLNLNNVDLILAFKRLNGIAAPNMSENIPVNPILKFNKEDKRFIENRDVLNLINNDTNLALMPWEDFEHFVRDLFEKEFSSTGGEVKITQSSRDGGIDAIAFDPDPIRGGKIVIQSKRYTNVVGVSAVRDLYGTMINEGANKGILVTTSHFGSDAYEFVKNKPLTLIDGGNLLQLLMKHNYDAKIDLNEARNKNKFE